MSGRQLEFDPIAEARRQWDLHWRSEATPQMVAVTSIMRAQQILLMRLNALLEPLDLTFPRYETLMVLYYSRHGELPLGKLSDRLQVHRASVTNVIDKLEASGYVTRIAHERDRRTIRHSHNLQLSPLKFEALARIDQPSTIRGEPQINLAIASGSVNAATAA